MGETIFDLNNVCYSYLGKYPALRGIDLSIRQGQKVAVIGANGSGKSTLLHLLDGLIFPDQGRISFFGKELKENDFSNAEFSRGFRRKVGLVFQNPDVQLFCPSVREDIVFGPLQLGFAQAVIQNRLEKVVTMLNISGLLDRQPHQLSVGEKRKVAMASVLILRPDVLLYLTDGLGTFPKIAPKAYRVLWCLTSPEKIPWGRSVELGGREVKAP